MKEDLKMNLSQIFRTRFRIVRDNYSGFETQFRYWWMPFYLQGRSNTHPTIEKAKNYIEIRKTKVLYYE